MSVPDWRQPQGLRGRPGFKPTCRAEFATWTASGQASVPVGGGRAWPGFETTRQANDQQPSAGGVEAAAGPAGHASVPVGGGRAWPGFETTHQANDQQPSTVGMEAAAGPAGHASVPVGGGRTWLGFETTHQANDQQPSAGGVEAAAGPAGQVGLQADVPSRVRGMDSKRAGRPRCRWAAAGPGRASRSITPSRRLACGDLAGGPPPTGTHSGQTQQDRPRDGRARRRPENPWCHKPHPKVRTPRSTPGSGRPGGRRGDRAR